MRKLVLLGITFALVVGAAGTAWLTRSSTRTWATSVTCRSALMGDWTRHETGSSEKSR